MPWHERMQNSSSRWWPRCSSERGVCRQTTQKRSRLFRWQWTAKPCEGRGVRKKSVGEKAGRRKEAQEAQGGGGQETKEAQEDGGGGEKGARVGARAKGKGTGQGGTSSKRPSALVV